MPDVHKRRILGILLFTLLGNSGLACACALMSTDTPEHAHHGMADGHGKDAAMPGAGCAPACGGHGSTALSGKTAAFPDFHADKSAAPVLHYQPLASAFPANTFPSQRPANQRSRPPLSTPVSRRDTLLD